MHIQERTFPLSPRALTLITSTHKFAFETDMVRAVIINPDNTIERSLVTYIAPFLNPAPADNVRDAALMDALIHHDAMWYDIDGRQATHFYHDTHGCWCTECSQTVVIADDGGHVCSNPTCSHFQEERVPMWLKEIRNLP